MADLFMSETARALKETLEAMLDDESKPRPDPVFFPLKVNGHVLLKWSNEGYWYTVPEPTCECGSGCNTVGPGHSDWCRCYAR